MSATRKAGAERRNRICERAGPLGARDRGARLRDRLSRRDRRQRRPAEHRRGLRSRDELPAVDPERLPAHPRLPDPARWVARGSPRPAADLRDRHRLVHRGVVALRDRPERQRADRRPAAAGRRRRPAHPGQPGDDRVELPAGRSGPGDRGVVGARRRRHGARPAARRLPGRGGLLAGDLPDQRPDRPVRGRDGHPPRSRDPGPRRPRQARQPGRGPRRGRPRGNDLRADRGARRHDRNDPRGRGRRCGGPDRVHRHGAPQRQPDDAAGPVRLPTVQRRQPRHVRRLRGARRRLLPPRGVPPDRRRLLAGGRGRRLIAGDAADAVVLGPGRRPRPADRRSHPPHRRAARDRRSACC